MDALLKNKVVLIMVLLILGAVGYYFFFADETQPTEQNIQNDIVGKKVVETLDTLNSLDLDGRIFENVVYQSLVEIEAPIPTEKQGRNNPFAPVN